MTDIEYFRKYIPANIPFTIRELLIANMVVGNYSLLQADAIATVLSKHFARAKE